MRRVVAARACLCCLIAFVATGCATPPAVKRDYLDATAWRGSALTGVGRQMVVDAAAGAAPQTVTLIDVNAAGGSCRRRRAARSHSRTGEWRTCERNCTATELRPSAIGEWPGPAPGGVQTYPPGELQTKQMVVIAHY